MTSDREYFYGKTATISFKPDGGTAIDVGVLQGVEITAVPELVDLEGAGTVKRVGIAIKKWRVTCTGTVRSIDFALIADICSSSGASWTDGTGVFTGIEDTDTPSYFDVTATVDSDTGKTLTVTAKNVVFKDLAILVGTWGEWVEWPLEGEGDDYTATETP